MRYLLRNVLLGVVTMGLFVFAYSTESNGPEARSDEGHRAEPRPSEEAAFALVWGANGHRITGEIAERYLTEATRTALDALIGDTVPIGAPHQGRRHSLQPGLEVCRYLALYQHRRQPGAVSNRPRTLRSRRVSSAPSQNT